MANFNASMGSKLGAGISSSLGVRGPGGKAHYNFTRFNNWDVVMGRVDIVGEGEQRFHPSFFAENATNLLPGRRLYIDLTGTKTFPTEVVLGKIETKLAFPTESGVIYRFRYQLAGNQRGGSGFSVRVTFGTLFTVDWLEPSGSTPFVQLQDDIVGDGDSHKIGFEQMVPLLSGNIGNLLNDVSLKRLDTGEVLFHDDFDDEYTDEFTILG